MTDWSRIHETCDGWYSERLTSRSSAGFGLCVPLYALSREEGSMYRPLLQLVLALCIAIGTCGCGSSTVPTSPSASRPPRFLLRLPIPSLRPAADLHLVRRRVTKSRRLGKCPSKALRSIAIRAEVRTVTRSWTPTPTVSTVSRGPSTATIRSSSRKPATKSSIRPAQPETGRQDHGDRQRPHAIRRPARQAVGRRDATFSATRSGRCRSSGACGRTRGISRQA